jgi:hypothetical protein
MIFLNENYIDLDKYILNQRDFASIIMDSLKY